jgi:hypothetical protein
MRLQLTHRPKEKNMRLLILYTAMCISILLTGCATVKDWTATGGSRSDGVVRLSYEVSEMESAQVSESQALDVSGRRCKIWGYSGSEAFGGVTRNCAQQGGFGGCSRWIITKEYQCTGTGSVSSVDGKPKTE